MSSPPSLLPWGRLVLVLRHGITSLPDHFDLARSKHCVGRVASRCDVHIPIHYISGLHCIIRYMGKESNGTPLVQIEDQSRYGTWLNAGKVGYRRKAMLKNGDRIHFTSPDSKTVTEIVYRFEILPSGLTKKNEDLHARVSADEMSVAHRTRKRTHEELQCTQSPTKVILSPPRPRPVKKMRRVTAAFEEAKEPTSKSTCSSATQPAQSNKVQVSSARAAGKKRRLSDAPVPDSNIAQIQKENQVLRDILIQKEELEVFRDENEILKKTHAEELAKMKAKNAVELAKVKAEAAAQLAKVKKQAATKLATVNAQVAAEMGALRKELSELREERDTLKRTVNHILQDPNVPHQVRTIAELEAKIHELHRTIRTRQDDLAYQQERSQTTPPSQNQLEASERKVRELKLRNKNLLIVVKQQAIELLEGQGKIEEATKMNESTATGSSTLSGSSQSQDSIDNGRLHSTRRGSLPLSAVSNEHSEPSPGDIPQTFDAVAEEAKSGDVSQGEPPVFNIYGTDSASADKRPITHSRPQLYRATMKTTSLASQESQKGENEEETKENRVTHCNVLQK